MGAASSGVLFAPALPPYDVPLLGFIAFAPVLAGVSSARPNAILYLAMSTALTATVVLLGVPREPSYTLVLIPFLVFGMFLAVVLARAEGSTSLAVADVPLGDGQGTLATQLGDAFVLWCGLLVGSLSLARYTAGRGRSFRE